MKTNQYTFLRMEHVCIIQELKEKIDPSYNHMKDFNKLWKLSLSQLEAERDKLIPIYNETIKNQNL